MMLRFQYGLMSKNYSNDICNHRRRLVINIGGGQKIWGKFIFRPDSDSPFITDYFFYCVFRVSFLLGSFSIFSFLKKIKKFSSDYRVAKKGFCPPILIIGGACLGCLPPSLCLCL